MGDKLRNYQVLDVLCGGTFYKVRHKVTRNIFAWRAFDCSSFSREQLQKITNEVKTISSMSAEHHLKYYDTILHAPSKTLYFVVEYIPWRSLEDVICVCKDTDKYVAESFVWYILYELSRICKTLESFRFSVLRKSVTARSVHVDESGDLRVNCFDISVDDERTGIMRQVGDLVHAVCARTTDLTEEIRGAEYSDDLRDALCLLRDDRNSDLRPDVVLYHPTVLSNLELTVDKKRLSECLLPTSKMETNLCDSEKEVESCASNSVPESPAYVNMKDAVMCSRAGSVSPTIEALALELPGFVPRSRHPICDTHEGPQRATERALSHQWMSRLIALREREASLNRRERDIISKEIANSPCAIKYRDDTDGITLPTIIPSVKEEMRGSRGRRASLRCKRARKSCYEDLDSSLSADDGDDDVVITAAKITKENMPRRSIFPEVTAKRVHFTSANPFVESDESVTLTFYELDDAKGPRLAKCDPNVDISKFKYLDMERVTRGNRAALQWSHSSPSKRAKTSCRKQPLIDITNHSRNVVSNGSSASKAPTHNDVKKSKGRKSLLSFKTPFKFIASSKV